ncbi:DUF2059 domain-containing protein [Pseudomonadota bacterium]
MKKGLIVALMLLLPTTGMSEEQTKRENIEALLSLTNAESTVDGMYAQMGSMMQGMAQQLGIKPSERELFNQYMEKLFSTMKAEMSWDKMKAPMIDIYTKHYSNKELQDMVAFYKSESGKSMIEKMPMVIQDSMQVSQSMMKDFVPKMQALSEEMRAELVALRSNEQPKQ